MKSLVYTVNIEPVEEGGYFVSVPALPGCFTQGETYDEAMRMAEDAIRLWVETLEKNGEPVPHEPLPSGPSSVLLRVAGGVAA